MQRFGRQVIEKRKIALAAVEHQRAARVAEVARIQQKTQRIVPTLDLLNQRIERCECTRHDITDSSGQASRPSEVFKHNEKLTTISSCHSLLSCEAEKDMKFALRSSLQTVCGQCASAQNLRNRAVAIRWETSIQGMDSSAAPSDKSS